MKRLILICLCLALSSIVLGCTGENSILNRNDPDYKNWRLVEQSGKNSVVTLYVDMEDEAGLSWLRSEFSQHLRDKYGIELNVIEQSQVKTFDILKQDKLNEIEIGKMDVILFSDKGFRDALKNGYLYGPFVDKLPNVKNNLNRNDVELIYHDGIKMDSHLVPIGRQQLLFIYNQDYFYDLPTDYEGLFELMKSFKGKMTYPDPRYSLEGEAFITGYLSRGLDFEKLYEKQLGEAEFFELIKDSINRLNDLKPNLYMDGREYPSSLKKMDELFYDESLLLSMSLDYHHATDKLKDYEYPDGAKSFALKEGSTGALRHMGILFNSGNKSGAMLVINEMLSIEMQVSKYDFRKWRQLTIYDPNYASTEAFSEFKQIKVKNTAVKHEELLANRIPYISSYYRDMMIKLWEKHVLLEASE